MRSEVGKISLDTVFKEREQLNIAIVDALNKASEPWGIICKRYEIRTMTMPERIQQAMQMQVRKIWRKYKNNYYRSKPREKRERQYSNQKDIVMQLLT
jgi:regulator of protease activity HflC (stomatin/prohibitin superfamily)